MHFSHEVAARVLLVTSILAVAVTCSTIASADDVDRPNIVLIMADDLGMECLGCYGGRDYATPRLDELAASGLRFTHAYSQPLCTPTRLELMTGKYNHRNWEAFGILPQGERTIGHLMSDLGYRTCISGKWQLTSYDPPDFPGAEKRRGTGTHPDDSGFDEYSLFHAEETEDKGSRYANPTFLRNGELHKEVEGAYGEDLNVDFILDFLRRHHDEPTFVYYPMVLPHWPMVPTPHSEVWSDASRRLEEDTVYFKDMVEYLDYTVGRLVDGIDDLGLRERTLVLFYSDNGTDRRITSRRGGEEIQGGKGEVTQNGIRVPLIANWPGVIGRDVCDDLVDATDFLPTLAELAGGGTPEDWGADGVSFAPQLSGERGTPREWVFFWYDPRPGWDKERFRRHVFALNRDYKIFSDGGFFYIEGNGFREDRINPRGLSRAQALGAAKLLGVIRGTMQPPLSAVAREEVDAYGEPVE